MRGIRSALASWVVMALMLSSVPSLTFAAPTGVENAADNPVAEGHGHASSIDPGKLSKGEKLLSYFGVGINGKAHVPVKEVATLRMPFEARSMDFSPDGKYLAASSLINDSENDLQIRIWDWRTGEIYRTLKLSHDFNAIESKEGIKWSPDGRFLAACGRTMDDGIIRVWNTNNGEIVKNIKDSGTGGCNSISFTSDGKWLILIIDRANSGGDSLIFYDTRSWEKAWGTPISDFLDRPRFH